MKKILSVIIFFICFFGNSFALSSDEILSNIEKVKTYFLSQQTGYFDKIQSEVVNKLTEGLNSIYSGEDVDILLNVGKIEKVDLKIKFLDDFINIKNNFVTELTEKKNKLSLIEEKKKYGLLTGVDYDTQLSTINFEVSALSGKYTNLLSGLEKLYLNKLNQLSGNVKKVILQNQGLLNFVKKRKKKLENIIQKYNEFEKIYDKINELFLGVRGSYIGFLNNFEKEFRSILDRFFDKIIDKYFETNENFKRYGSGLIYSYKKKLINSALKDIEDYFNSLLDIGVDKDTLNWIIETKNLLYNKYFDGNDYNRKNLLNDDYINQVYDRFIKKLDQLIDKFNSKLADYNYPNDKSQISKVLKKKLEDFIKLKTDNFTKDFENYINSLKPYIIHQAEEADKYYKNIWDKYYKCEVLTGEDKFNCFEELHDLILEGKKIIKDLNKIKLLNKLFWQVEIEKVDYLIKKEGLDYYNLKYKNIDNLLDDILEKIYRKFETNGKVDSFKEKLERGIKKIDNLLNSGVSLNEETKYLLLKIKKAFIKFLYLR